MKQARVAASKDWQATLMSKDKQREVSIRRNGVFTVDHVFFRVFVCVCLCLCLCAWVHECVMCEHINAALPHSHILPCRKSPQLPEHLLTRETILRSRGKHRPHWQGRSRTK